jgi:hypothetical protein
MFIIEITMSILAEIAFLAEQKVPSQGPVRKALGLQQVVE